MDKKLHQLYIILTWKCLLDTFSYEKTLMEAGKIASHLSMMNSFYYYKFAMVAPSALDYLGQ